MKYVFGPLPSRRLGQSLGIDPIPMKTCNWNCVYCQLGRSSALEAQRRMYAPPEDILAEAFEAIEKHGRDGIDWVTFVGSGEPTLHAGLGWMIDELKRRSPIPVAVLTNGSLLDLPEVRRDLRGADAVMPSLDAGTERLYRQINRAAKPFGLDRLVRGLEAFRAEYSGRLWIEVMLISGLNDGDEALRDLAAALHRIGPDEVHINLPVRPPAEPWVEPPPAPRIARAAEILGGAARVVAPQAGPLRLSATDNAVEAILSVIARHPMSEAEITGALADRPAAEIAEALRQLERSGRAAKILRSDEAFWTGADAHYVDAATSRCHAAPRSAEDKSDFNS